MESLAAPLPGGLSVRPDWMPDPGVFLYVQDVLAEIFEIDARLFPEHWLPLGIVGTLDWLAVCGWWVWENTGVFDTDEPYKWVFVWNEVYEFDPDKLLIFRENEELNQYDTRFAEPHLKGREQTEAVSFLLQDVYPDWQKETPPREIVELILWSTLMWVLSRYGRDWLYSQDAVFAHVYDFGVAYVSKWDGELLDPKLMKCTQRPIGTCKNCGTEIWCVLGYYIDDYGEKRWDYLCNHCAIELRDAGVKMDEKDRRISAPDCHHHGGTCMNTTCPHSGWTKEAIHEKMREWGSQRVEEYREAKKMAGGSPRAIGGQTADDVVEYFHRVR